MNQADFESLLEKLPPSAARNVQELLGCQWGRGVSAPDDGDPCPKPADNMVVLHDGDVEITLKLCAEHRAIVDENSTPRD